MSIGYITIYDKGITINGNSAMSALATFVREEMERQGINQLDLARRAEIPNSTLARHLNDEVEEWKPSVILKVAEGLNIPFWRLMIVAGYPVDSQGSPETQNRRLAELAAAFPWLQPVVEDLTALTPEDREAVLLMLETIRRRRDSQSE